MSSVYKKKCSNWLWNDQTAKVQVYFYFFIVCIISVSYQGSHWSVGSHWYCVMWLCACRHYPVGVLFDLYGSTRNLPWNLTVHYEVSTFGGGGGGGGGLGGQTSEHFAVASLSEDHPENQAADDWSWKRNGHWQGFKMEIGRQKFHKVSLPSKANSRCFSSQNISAKQHCHSLNQSV